VRLVGIILCVVLSLTAAACGPSSAEIKQAQTASYAGSPAEILAVVEQAVGEEYKIVDIRRADGYAIVTDRQWYTPEGGRQSAGAGNYVQLDDRSVNLSLLVELVEMDQNRIMVTVTPTTLQYISGSPQPRELKPEDPNLPPWVHGRVESLYVEINKRLKKYVVQ
jgi:hypothetical protein